MDLIKGYRFFSESECQDLVRYCDNKEAELQKYHDQMLDGATDNGKIPVTQRYHSLYNFFAENPEHVPRLLAGLRETLPELEYPIAVQSWVNIYRKGQGIMWHTHGGKNGYSFSANIFLAGQTAPGIYYSVNPEDTYNVENEVGAMHLFPHSLNHMVPPSESDEKRYTIGITIHAYNAIDKALVHGLAQNAESRETIILSQ